MKRIYYSLIALLICFAMLTGCGANNGDAVYRMDEPGVSIGFPRNFIVITKDMDLNKVMEEYKFFSKSSMDRVGTYIYAMDENYTDNYTTVTIRCIKSQIPNFYDMTEEEIGEACKSVFSEQDNAKRTEVLESGIYTTSSLQIYRRYTAYIDGESGVYGAYGFTIKNGYAVFVEMTSMEEIYGQEADKMFCDILDSIKLDA